MRHDPAQCEHCRQNHGGASPIDRPPAWVADAVFYQVFPDRFARSDRLVKPNGLEKWSAPPTIHGYKGGDLAGIADRLDWLTDLGINAIYLNPIFQSGSNHRYHTHDYYRVDPLLGGNAAFDDMLEACHARGVRVILDGVFNHASRGFFQFHDVLENGRDSPYSDWFHIHGWPLHPYSQSHPANYEAWWGLKALPKFNTDNPQVREYLMKVGEYWVRKGIDGWRLDVPEEIGTTGFWEEFRDRVRAINPEAYIVGEVWGDASWYISTGERFDATMNYQWTAATISYTVGGRLDHNTRLDNPLYAIAPPLDAAGYRDRIAWLLGRYPEEATLANLNLLDSHDTARIRSIASGDVESVILSLVLLLTFPGAPCIYYGTEIGLRGGKDPDSRRTFPWTQQATWSTEILSATKELINLRREHPALRSPLYRPLWPTGPGDGTMVYAFERRSGDDRIVVIVNAGDATESHAVPYETVSSNYAEILWGTAKFELGKNHLRVTLPPRSAVIWRMGDE
jgi:glycosidase